MQAQPLNDEVALRIGLAVKELECVATGDLLNLLISIMGEPITQAKLEKLRARKMRTCGEQLFARVETAQFENAFALLKGRGIKQYLNPEPDIEPGAFCEVYGAIRVACASNSGEFIDGQFTDCVRFLIYQISPNYIRLIDIREPSNKLPRADRYQARARLLEDCALLYTTQIGAMAQAQVIKVGLHPVKLGKSEPAQTELHKLQAVLAQDNPPPWLKKAMQMPTLGVKLYSERNGDTVHDSC